MLFTPPEHWHKLHEVHCGIDRAFLDVPSSGPLDSARFVCVGRLSPEKGQLMLVEAAARLREEGVHAEIVLVGDGPLRGDIERRARELGMEAMIHVAGWQSSSDVRRSMLQSRAVVMPSFVEGIPVALMEAMALRLPVIATYVGGIPELVRSGETGWLVPAGSVAELASAMRKVLATPIQHLAEMGELGRHVVVERHDVTLEGKKLAALFEAALYSDGVRRTRS